jgi:hypothetical protein
MTRRSAQATISLVPTAAGGRSDALRSGYRSLIRFDGSSVDFGFELELPSDGSSARLGPGESGRARLSFWAIDELPPLHAGLAFEVREGARVIGHGVVQ